MSKKVLIVFTIFIALAFFLLGYLFSGQIKKALNNGIEDSFKTGWEAANQRLKDIGLAPKSYDEILTITGEIKAINGDKITLKIRPLEPLADADLDVRIVEVDSGSALYELGRKDDATYQKELAEYNQQTRPSGTSDNQGLSYPSLFTKKTISLTDLKTGQRISVVAGENIRFAGQFKAIEITVQPTSVQSAVAPESE